MAFVGTTNTQNPYAFHNTVQGKFSLSFGKKKKLSRNFRAKRLPLCFLSVHCLGDNHFIFLNLSKYKFLF